MSKVMCITPRMVAAALYGKAVRVTHGWIAIETPTGATRVRQWTGTTYVAHDDDTLLGGTIVDLRWFSDSDVWLLFSWGVCHWDGTGWAEVVSDATYSTSFVSLAGTSSSDLYLVAYGPTSTKITYYHWTGSMSGPSTVTYGTPVSTTLTSADQASGGPVRVGGNKIVTLTGTPAVEYTPGQRVGRLWARTSAISWATLRVPSGGATVVQDPGTGWAMLGTQPDYSSAVGAFFYGLHGTSDTDVWVAGSVEQPAGTFNLALRHWDGSAWTAPPLGSPSPQVQELRDVWAGGTADVWAGGYTPDGSGTPQVRAFYYDGSSWMDRSPVT